MADVYIANRAEKLRFLRESELAQQIGLHSGSESAFATAIGVARSTANDWIEGNTRRQTIDTAGNSKIAQRFRFPADWDPWLTKSAEVFKAEYEKLARNLLNEAAPPEQPRHIDRPLRQGADRDIDRGPIRGLGSIELTCGNTGRGETVIGVKISCGDAIIPVSPFPITIRAGEIEIDCGHARATDDSVKGAAREGAGRFDAIGTHGVVRCKWSGDFQRLRWMLDSTGASIGTLVFEPGVLAKIVRLAPGDTIKGTFGAYLKDIEGDETLPAPLDDFTVVDRLGERPRLPEEQLSTLQRRIVEHLRKSVLKPNAEGFAVISAHELQFVEMPQT